MPKVREVFAKAYGPIPEGATCHVGYETRNDDSLVSPTWRTRAEGTHTVQGGDWAYAMSRYVIGGDISECDAAAFSPVFECAAYDAALDALTKEEGEKHDAQDWVDRYSGEWLEGPDHGTVIALADANELLDALGVPRLAKVQPDPRTVIALADAWMVADDEFVRERDPDMIVTRIDNAKATKKRFREASREFWAALSADGTGESPVLSTHLDVMGEGK